jgi:hypothetical protein
MAALLFSDGRVLTTTVADVSGKVAVNSGSSESPYCTGSPWAAACRSA